MSIRPDSRLLVFFFMVTFAGTTLAAACRSATTSGVREREFTPTTTVRQGATVTRTAPASQARASAPTIVPFATTAPARIAAITVTATITPTGRMTRPTPTNTPTPVPSPSPTHTAHVVRAEETLSGIAAGYGVSIDAVMRANDLQDPNLLVAGQELLIPPATGENVLPALPTRDYGYAIIGFSGQGRAIEAFSFGNGATHLVLVGGIHGGYEWNTVLLAYQMIDYFYGNQEQIPETITLHIMPAANPDGLYLVTGRTGRFSAGQVSEPPRAARFNGRGVDVNRNWSCGWSPSARWGGLRVDPGSEPFSEPETRALRDYFLELRPAAVIFWHSQANLVAPGRCGEDAGSARLAEIYGEASGYPPGPFTAYELTGTASDWLNEQGIPAAAVELADHENTASGQNLAGIFALFDFYGAGAAAE